MADPMDDEKAAKLAELQAKMAEAKARREAAAASAPPASASPAPAAAPETPAAAPAAAATPAAAPAGGDDKAAKLAELQAKMAEAKAKREAAAASGGAEASTAAATATATAEPVIKTETDAKVAAMRQKISETQVREGVPGAQGKQAAAAAAPGAPAGGKPKQTKSDSDVGVWFLGRRSFMQSIGWMSFFGFLTIVILGAVRAMFPRVIYERPPVFKAGFPSDYVPGAVSEKYKDEERVWIIRQGDGSFIALLAICTHLGCTPRWLASENKFKCPCHGSGFRGTPSWGVNFEGPAPRPLERVGIHLSPDGQIEIDKSKKYLWEKGQWEDPAATLRA